MPSAKEIPQKNVNPVSLLAKEGIHPASKSTATHALPIDIIAYIIKSPKNSAGFKINKSRVFERVYIFLPERKKHSTCVLIQSENNFQVLKPYIYSNKK